MLLGAVIIKRQILSQIKLISRLVVQLLLK